MPYKIDESILSKTTCEHKFKCLTNGNCPNCEAVRPSEMDYIYVKMKGNKDCPYAISFDGDSICSCPTRREIYRKYKV